MSNLVTIGNRKVQRIEYKGVPVVTFRMIDELHGRTEGTAKKNWGNNKGRFIEGEDFFRASNGDLQGLGKILPRAYQYAPQVVFLTQTGYLMLVKSLNDDLAWQIQREMVNVYFQHKNGKVATAQKSECPMKDIIADLVDALERNSDVLNLVAREWNARRSPLRRLMPVIEVNSKGRVLCPTLCPMR